MWDPVLSIYNTTSTGLAKQKHWLPVLWTLNYRKYLCDTMCIHLQLIHMSQERKHHAQKCLTSALVFHKPHQREHVWTFNPLLLPRVYCEWWQGRGWPVGPVSPGYGAWSVAAVCAVCAPSSLIWSHQPGSGLSAPPLSISLKRRSGEQTSGHSFGPESWDTQPAW